MGGAFPHPRPCLSSLPPYAADGDQAMKCPHCGRTWDNQEFVQEGLSPTVVLSDHVHRFCPGTPDGWSAPRGARPVPVVAHSRAMMRR